MWPVDGRPWRRRRRPDGPVLELAFAPTAAVALVAGLAVELRLFAPGRVPGRREAIVWSAGWLLLALAVAVGIALAGGPAGEWTTVYLIERSLSLDNVFLFSLLLAYFLVPPELRGRVVLIGVAGALLLRGIAIAGGVALVESVDAIVYLFGALLLFVAYRALRGADEASDPAANPVLRFVGRLLPSTDDFRGRRLFVREAGRLYGTPLLLVVVAVIAADIAFAVDSIPAAFAVTRDPLVIWTANAFALLGLGSLLALVEILVRRFRYIDETIALVLAFVGIKILAADVVQISDLVSLAVVAALLAGGIVASLVADRLAPPRATEEATRRPPRCPRELRTPGLPAAADFERGRASGVVQSEPAPSPTRRSGLTYVLRSHRAIAGARRRRGRYGMRPRGSARPRRSRCSTGQC
jgi:tellurite resistance protein TerC